jgi:plasmid stabilization system protein ParE
MSYKLVFLDLAFEDKRKIKTYLKQFYPSTPKKFITTLKDRIKALKDNPYMYPVMSTIPLTGK